MQTHKPMNRLHRAALLFALAASAGLSACTASRSGPTRAPDERARQLDALSQAMTGDFDSSAQASADPDYREIHLRMRPIWPAHTTPHERWLYVEQAAAQSLDKPYRQRIYRLWAEGTPPTLTLVSEVYELPGDPLAFAGAWAQPERFDALTPAQLTLRPGCAVRLTPGEAGFFSGSTEANTCISTLRGAAYATSKVWIDPQGLRTWDQGFNAAGEQVWGATKGPYDFRRKGH